MNQIIFKKLSTLKELEAVRQCEDDVWKMPGVPVHQTLTVAKNGGIILGAYDGEQLIGFNYGFPGFKNGAAYLCSHMTGIKADYRKHNIGYDLKMKQQEEARQIGYKLITWTFDPLESVNGYLNLTKLRGIGASYLENLYGELDDALNNGLPSDRFQVEWWIDSPHVQEDKQSLDNKNHPTLAHLNDLLPGKFPALWDSVEEEIAESDSWLVPVPTMFQEIKKEAPDLAWDWRMKTRMMFRNLFASGYVAIRVIKSPDPRICHYLFLKRDLVESY